MDDTSEIRRGCLIKLVLLVAGIIIVVIWEALLYWENSDTLPLLRLGVNLFGPICFVIWVMAWLEFILWQGRRR